MALIAFNGNREAEPLQGGEEVALKIGRLRVSDKVDIKRVAVRENTAVVRCGGLHAQDKIESCNVRLHAFGNPNRAEIREREAGFSLANAVEDRLHNQIFERQRNEANQGVALVLHVCGDHCAHVLCRDLRAHFALDHLADFLKGVFAEPRIKLRNRIHCKVAKRLARKKIAEVHGDQKLDPLALLCLRNALCLPAWQSLHHGRAEENRQARAARPRLRKRILHGQGKAGQIQKSALRWLLRRAPGICRSSARRHGACVSKEAVCNYEECPALN